MHESYYCLLLTCRIIHDHLLGVQIEKARVEAEHLRQDAEDEAAAQSRAIEDEFDDSDKPQRKYALKNPEKVLVRLKVEHSGFTTLNNQRFGSKFVGQVVSIRFCTSFLVHRPHSIVSPKRTIFIPPTHTHRPIHPIFYSFISAVRWKLLRVARVVLRGRSTAMPD